MAKKVTKKHLCKLPPYKVEEVLSLSEVGQKLGWEITSFNLPDAWSVTLGEGVKIAVCDTGCDLDHPDLVSNLLPGINLVKPGTPPQDDNQHGTHVAGIICAENNAIGMVGVAPKAQIIPVKVLDEKGSGNFTVVAQGIRWAVDNGADIISMSLGSPNPLAGIRKAIQYAASKGVPVFVAAGNAGKTKEVFYPANYPETIAVGSIDENFDRSTFSNTGDRLDFMAPGGKIFSTVPDNWYAYLSGTSMACPFVVGIAALCLSYQRKHFPNKPLKGADSFRQLFRKHTMPISNPAYAGQKFFQGFGIIDTRDFKKWIETNQ
jgi:subtilisin family serine protease